MGTGDGAAPTSTTKPTKARLEPKLTNTLDLFAELEKAKQQPLWRAGCLDSPRGPDCRPLAAEFGSMRRSARLTVNALPLWMVGTTIADSIIEWCLPRTGTPR